jgi:hypothetical protein
MQPEGPSIWLRDSIENASGKAGALQIHSDSKVGQAHETAAMRDAGHKGASRSYNPILSSQLP